MMRSLSPHRVAESSCPSRQSVPAPIEFTQASTTDAASALSRPITTGVDGLMIPAFSEAIASKVWPRIFVWSKPMVVMIEARG